MILLKHFFALACQTIFLNLRHALRVVDELQNETVRVDERVVQDETVANAEHEPPSKIGAGHARQTFGQIFMDAVRHRLEVTVAERTFFALFREEDEKGVPIRLADGNEIVLAGLDSSHIENEIRQDRPNLVIDRCTVVVLDRREIRGVDIEKRERAVLFEPGVNLIQALPVAIVVFYIESRRFLIRDSPRPATTYEQKTGGADGVKGA